MGVTAARREWRHVGWHEIEHGGLERGVALAVLDPLRRTARSGRAGRARAAAGAVPRTGGREHRRRAVRAAPRRAGCDGDRTPRPRGRRHAVLALDADPWTEPSSDGRGRGGRPGVGRAAVGVRNDSPGLVASPGQSPVAQLAEQPAVNRQVTGSSPVGGATQRLRGPPPCEPMDRTSAGAAGPPSAGGSRARSVDDLTARRPRRPHVHGPVGRRRPAAPRPPYGPRRRARSRRDGSGRGARSRRRRPRVGGTHPRDLPRRRRGGRARCAAAARGEAPHLAPQHLRPALRARARSGGAPGWARSTGPTSPRPPATPRRNFRPVIGVARRLAHRRPGRVHARSRSGSSVDLGIETMIAMNSGGDPSIPDVKRLPVPDQQRRRRTSSSTAAT